MTDVQFRAGVFRFMDLPSEVHLMILTWSFAGNSVVRIGNCKHRVSAHRRLDSVDKLHDIKHVSKLLHINRYIRETIFEVATFYVNVAAQTPIHGKGKVGCAGIRRDYKLPLSIHQATQHGTISSRWRRHVPEQTFLSFSRYNIHIQDEERRHYPRMLDELCHILRVHEKGIISLDLICTVTIDLRQTPGENVQAHWQALLTPLRSVCNVQEARVEFRVLLDHGPQPSRVRNAGGPRKVFKEGMSLLKGYCEQLQKDMCRPGAFRHRQPNRPRKLCGWYPISE